MSDTPEGLAANRRFWDGWPEIPKEMQKTVSRGSYSFTNIDAYFVIECLTSKFGPMGEGWGVRDVKIEREHGFVFVTGTFWWSSGTVNEIELATSYRYYGKRKNGEAFYDEDAPMKAMTRLISKGSSYLGIGHKIYQGGEEGGGSGQEQFPGYSGPMQQTEPPVQQAPPQQQGGMQRVGGTVPTQAFKCNRCSGPVEIRNNRNGVPSVYCSAQCGEPQYKGFCYKVSDAARWNKQNEFAGYGPQGGQQGDGGGSDLPPDDLPF